MSEGFEPGLPAEPSHGEKALRGDHGMHHPEGPHPFNPRAKKKAKASLLKRAASAMIMLRKPQIGKTPKPK